MQPVHRVNSALWPDRKMKVPAVFFRCSGAASSVPAARAGPVAYGVLPGWGRCRRTVLRVKELGFEPITKVSIDNGSR